MMERMEGLATLVRRAWQCRLDSASVLVERAPRSKVEREPPARAQGGVRRAHGRFVAPTGTFLNAALTVSRLPQLVDNAVDELHEVVGRYLGVRASGHGPPLILWSRSCCFARHSRPVRVS